MTYAHTARVRATYLLLSVLDRCGLLKRLMDQIAFRKAIGQEGRLMAFRALGAVIGENVRLASSCWMRRPENVSIGEGTTIGVDVDLDSWGRITIGARVIINGHCSLLTASHHVDSPTFEGDIRPITIGDYAWIPVHVRVLPGVDIGRFAVVGTGSVVTKSVPDYGIVAGNPARRIGERARHEYVYRVTVER